jgi:hypothetical protein
LHTAHIFELQEGATKAHGRINELAHQVELTNENLEQPAESDISRQTVQDGAAPRIKSVSGEIQGAYDGCWREASRNSRDVGKMMERLDTKLEFLDSFMQHYVSKRENWNRSRKKWRNKKTS